MATQFRVIIVGMPGRGAYRTECLTGDPIPCIIRYRISTMLNERRRSMTPENQALPDAFRTMIYEGNAPLAAGLERLEARVERLEQHVETIDGRMERLETRMERLETRMERVEQHVETIDARTSQLSSDFLDLRDRIPLLE